MEEGAVCQSGLQELQLHQKLVKMHILGPLNQKL